MPALKPGTIISTNEEDTVITAAALSDPDALPLTDAEWAGIKPMLRVGERPKADVTKMTQMMLSYSRLKVNSVWMIATSQDV
jgi:hypothetical protein